MSYIIKDGQCIFAEGTTAIHIRETDKNAITSLIIPASARTIDAFDFEGCTELTSIKVSLGNEVYDSREDCNAIIHTQSNCLVLGCSNTKIPDSVTEIGEGAFYHCTELTELVIPSSVYRIGKSALSGCTGLTKVEMPNSLEEIGMFAFSGCTGLTKVEIPDSVTEIGVGAFYGSGLTKLVIHDSVIEIDLDAFSHCTELTELVIPSSVTRIGTSAFSGCTGLTKVEMPDSLEEIGMFAFSGCTGLTKVEIPDSVEEIGDSAFSDCIGLTKVEIPDSVEEIGTSAFSGCTGLIKVEIPDSVTTIGMSAFFDCCELTELVIPDSVRTIGGNAFFGCYGLTSIKVSPGNKYYDSREDCNAIIDTQNNMLLYGCKNTKIPSSVTSIGPYAFFRCELTSIDIPDSVTEIGEGAFADCSELKEVKIPSSVITIEAKAFEDCTGLTKVVIPDSVKEMGHGVFVGCSNLKIIRPSVECMKEHDKLASKKATHSSRAKNIRLYFAKGLFKATLAIDPTARETLLDIKMKVSDLIGEIVPVEMNEVLVIATERFLMTDLNQTFEEFTEKEAQFYDDLYHRMKQGGMVSGKDEFQQLWDEASKLLQQVDKEIGGPLL